MAEYDRDETEDSTSLIEKAKKFIQDCWGRTLGPKGGPGSSQISIEDVRFNPKGWRRDSSWQQAVMIVVSFRGQNQGSGIF